MSRDRIDDALDAMSARELERLVERGQARLAACLLCGGAGAEPMTVFVARGPKRGAKASVMVCMPCFEKHRLPESRAAEVKP